MKQPHLIMKSKRPLTVAKKRDTASILSLQTLLVVLVFCMALALLIFVTRKIFYHAEQGFDEAVFLYLSHQVTPVHTAIMQVFTFLGSHFFLIPAWFVVFGYYGFIKKNNWELAKAVIIALTNLLLMFGLKYYFSRLRPPVPLLKEVPGFSFPSGHAYMSLIFFGLLIYNMYRATGKKQLQWPVVFILAAIIFMVGLSRVYLRLHYASDVISGYCFSLLSLIILLWILRQVEKTPAAGIPCHAGIPNKKGYPAMKKVD